MLMSGACQSCSFGVTLVVKCFFLEILDPDKRSIFLNYRRSLKGTFFHSFGAQSEPQATQVDGKERYKIGRRDEKRREEKRWKKLKPLKVLAQLEEEKKKDIKVESIWTMLSLIYSSIKVCLVVETSNTRQAYRGSKSLM